MAPSTSAPRKTKIAIVGGGFAGVYTAQHLERLLAHRSDVEITLYNRDNYFVFQPLLPEVVSGTIGLLDTVSPIRHMLKRTQLAAREVESIDLGAKRIRTSGAFTARPHDESYDHLVLALGNVTDFRGLTGLAEHALPFKNLADALAVRSHVIRALEEADLEAHEPALRRQLLTFVVAGGGFSGVEVAAELNDFVRGVARRYPSIREEELRVVLVHSGDRILPEMDPSLAKFAQDILQKRGVEIRTKARLGAATGQEAILSDGERIPTQTLISTVPSSPHPLVDALPLPKVKGRIQVDAHLRVAGLPGVWALGDCALVPGPDGQPAPPTAQHATRQGRLAAENIAATLAGRPELARFDFRGLGKMGSLGRRTAVAEVFGLKISGFLAWFLWRTVYLMKMPGWGRRLKVALSWTLDLFLPPELVQLRLEGSAGVTKEHFEPGQLVFAEGDTGDRLYILLAGAAEVVQREAGVVATLGPGDAFGEMALLSGQQRNASVRCTSAMDVLCLPKRDFSLLAAQLPDLRRSFEKITEERGRSLSREAS
ncbi:MAG: FAD-dependent oxidoreductase [Myxococcota bacterium]